MSRRILLTSLLALTTSVVACSDAGEVDGGGRYLVHNVVLGVDGETSYINTLANLDPQTIDFASALEAPGWGDMWIVGDMAFVSSGESPTVTRYAFDDAGVLTENGVLSFQNYGFTTVGLTRQLVVNETKAYAVNTTERELVIWNPTTLAITGTAPLPALPNRDALRLVGPSADRASAVRDGLAFIVLYWADYTEYEMANDSVILVIDTATDAIVNEISVPCPEMNFSTVDTDTGDIYFSNWGFSIASTIVHGTASACAVRIADGDTTLDESFSLTFTDVTDGREASSLRYIGDGKALITVHHSERLGAEADVSSIADGADYKLWTLDLDTLTATPLETFGFHAFGTYGARVDDATLLFLPSADWSSTTTYRLDADGTATTLWTSSGWQTRLFAMR